ncbi:unnamed protein product [Prorocentrum cordatum]|uniref:Endoplasmic reticulum resident protein 29 n=1 Tax=Prorocentrum cordatum TaxID=2364126 RepID=A0ABN9UY05_9DINO|nr:unnamed protein product [Polarella glacialis]
MGLVWKLVVASLWAPGAAGTAPGALKLDNYTLDKALGIPDFSLLLKVDQSYAYGDKEDQFKTLAKLAYAVPKFLIAEVPVQEYGDKENDDIRQRFKLEKADYPAYMLFSEANKEGLRYSGEVKAPELAVWLRKNGIKMPAIGTIAELDELAAKFLADKGAEHIKAAKSLAEWEFKGDRKAPMYVKIMERIRDKGHEFVKSERDRVSKIMQGGKISEEKKEEMQDKLNVLGSFEL